MDSPHLLHLGFLLLALAAPHPSIAKSSSGPAKGTQGSDSTYVAVYHCKDYKSCTCKSGEKNFENFTKIAETHTKKLSDVITDLVINETHITVCFEQTNSHLEGIYGVAWEKAARGAGVSCVILNSGENGRDNISTEEKNICCEAEADIWKRSHVLKCYAQKSHPKPTALAVGIPNNPEFLTTSKRSNIGILLAFLFVGVCTGWATMYYFLRLQRGQGDTDKLLTEKTSPIFDNHRPERNPVCQQHPPPLLSCTATE